MKTIIIFILNVTLLSLVLCNTTVSITGDDCLSIKDCDSCLKGKCAFWFCRGFDQKETGQTQCESPHSTTPETKCGSGHWRKLAEPDTCDSIKPTTTTTTTTHKPDTTTTPKPDTTSTTQSPNTTTTITPKPDTTTTPKPDTTSTTQNPNTTTTKTPETTVPPKTSTTTGPEPHKDTDRKLTGWTITGIVLSSLLVVFVLVGVAYKKVMKIYRARNPYHTLNE